MKKAIPILAALVIIASVSIGQTLNDGIKMLNSQFKVKSTREVFKKLYDANPKDPQTIYWYGQSLIAGFDVKPVDVQAAKTVYQKALADGVNDAWIWVGLGHIEILENGDLNSAKQKFEQAITTTTETKGKNKGKANPAILDAIGRANADGNSKQGDPVYGIDKLKQAATIDPNNADIYINIGISNLKLGGEYGGEAVKAFQEAARIDPKNALAPYRIAKIYVSQNNPDIFNKFFEDAIAANPNFADTYLALFEYYKYRDVNKAKDYLDKFIANADKDPINDLLLADYLFRAGKYAESLAKTKEIEAAVGVGAIPRLNMLYALDYDRLGDSVQSKTYVEKFFAAAPATEIKPDDYELAIKVFSKFPGNETTTVSYLEKAIASDTSKVNQLQYMAKAAEVLGKAKMYAEQLKWYQKIVDLKGTMTEADYLNLTYTAYLAKDYPQTMVLADKYITAYPDKSNGYLFKVRAAKALDTTTTPGIAVDAILQQNGFLMKEDSVKNKSAVIRNLYYVMGYYNDRAKDYAKALEIVDKVLELVPGDPDVLKAKDAIQKNMAKPSNKQPKAANSGAAAKPSTTPFK